VVPLTKLFTVSGELTPESFATQCLPTMTASSFGLVAGMALVLTVVITCQGQVVVLGMVAVKVQLTDIKGVGFCHCSSSTELCVITESHSCLTCSLILLISHIMSSPNQSPGPPMIQYWSALPPSSHSSTL
jgi:hypothetical protein